MVLTALKLPLWNGPPIFWHIWCPKNRKKNGGDLVRREDPVPPGRRTRTRKRPGYPRHAFNQKMSGPALQDPVVKRLYLSTKQRSFKTYEGVNCNIFQKLSLILTILIKVFQSVINGTVFRVLFQRISTSHMLHSRCLIRFFLFHL